MKNTPFFNNNEIDILNADIDAGYIIIQIRHNMIGIGMV